MQFIGALYARSNGVTLHCEPFDLSTCANRSVVRYLCSIVVMIDGLYREIGEVN